jgi:hypothetical protein
MATERIGKNSKIWIGGYVLSTSLREMTPPSGTRDEIEIGGFTQDHRTMMGMANPVASLNGFFDATTGSTHDALQTVANGATEVMVTMALGDNVAVAKGDETVSMVSVQSNYEASSDRETVIGVTANFAARGQPAETGVLLADETAVSAAGDTASIDNGASTSNGATGFLHITGVSAGDTITINIQDSANDSTWADHITFTADGTSVTSERGTSTGTVDRYTQAEWVVTGASIDFDFAVALIRN